MVEEVSDVVNHGTLKSALEASKLALSKAADAGRFLIAVWTVGDGRLVLDRTTWSFPTDRFDEAVQMLASLLLSEVKGLPTIPQLPEPLPTAAEFLERVRAAASPATPSSSASLDAGVGIPQEGPEGQSTGLLGASEGFQGASPEPAEPGNLPFASFPPNLEGLEDAE